MKILHINTFDTGGAGKACIRLHLGLLKQGYDSKLLLKRKTDNSIPETYQFKPKITRPPLTAKLKHKSIRVLSEFKLVTPGPYYKEKKFLQSRSTYLEDFSFPYAITDITQSPVYQEADIINLHWVADFLDYPGFFAKNNKPVVWTLHDMNPFSGGEHYEEKFTGINEKGYPIPRVLTKEEERWAKKILNEKKVIFKEVENLSIVALSNWLSNASRRSDIFSKYQHFLIPNGLDFNTFNIRNRKYSRELLGLPDDKIIILFIADSLTKQRKGYNYLKKTFAGLSANNICLCAIGRKSGLNETEKDTIELGRIYDERLMSVALSAADVFIIPSLMDNLPNTVLESLACGTPVIGFPVGGIPDMIQDGENGFLCTEISSTSLTDTIEKFLVNSNIFDREKIRDEAIKKYDLNIQSQAYIDLYNKILTSG